MARKLVKSQQVGFAFLEVCTSGSGAVAVSLRLRTRKDLLELIQMPIVMLDAIADSTGQVDQKQKWVGRKEGG